MPAPSWHALPVSEVAEALATDPDGLTAAEAEERRARVGWNDFEEAPPTRRLVVLVHQFASPLIYMLLLAGVVTLALGEHVDAAVIAAVLAINALIGYVQERRAESSVRSLSQMLSPHARVLRDGHEAVIESRELVPGDVVLLESGARVPADLRIAGATNLEIDESLLTGESVGTHKRTAPLDPGIVLADRANLAYSGTVVTKGRGRGYVVATGMTTELGSVAARVRTETGLTTPLQERMDRFARIVGIAIGAASALVFAVGVTLGETATDMFLAAVALAVAAIPEGLPVAFTIALALGVRRMAHRDAVVRRLPAVETLGSTTVIGSDKTGTLTQNRMTVQAVWTPAGTTAVAASASAPTADPIVHDALRTGILATEAEVHHVDGDVEVVGDPTEGALLIAASRYGLEPAVVREAAPVVARIPFESERRFSAAICAEDGGHVVHVAGAPERVLELCADMATPDGTVPIDADAVHGAARRLAIEGLRVVATATRRVDAPTETGAAGPVDEPRGLTLLGLAGMMDPPRPGVAEAIAGCQDAGIRVLMITGDHAVTARTIATRLGIAGPDARVLTGADLEQLSDDELEATVPEVAVYARVTPAHKLRVVRALQARGEVVAVTGDGVNDAAALKRADIGVAMGRSGTDVAREAADMVLTDDDFVSIYAAVEEGRVTFANVRKVTFFLLSSGVASILIVLTAVAAKWRLPLLPAQLLWLNLVTNGLQDVALAFEPGEPGTLDERPRRRSEGIVSPVLWTRTAMAGTVMALGTLLLYRWELARTDSVVDARSVGLTTLVLFMAFHVGNARSDTRSLFRMSPSANPFLLAATAGSVAIHAAALYWEPTQFVLRVAPVDAAAWARMTLVASSVLVVVELHKWVGRRRARRRG